MTVLSVCETVAEPTESTSGAKSSFNSWANVVEIVAAEAPAATITTTPFNTVGVNVYEANDVLRDVKSFCGS